MAAGDVHRGLPLSPGSHFVGCLHDGQAEESFCSVEVTT